MAEFNIASMYLYGTGVQSNRGTAQFWLALAAAHGNESAKAHVLVFSGAGDATPDAKHYAPIYFNDLAAGGSAAAQFMLGELYISGVIVPPNREEARRWFDLASRQGDARAAERLRVLRQ